MVLVLDLADGGSLADLLRRARPADARRGDHRGGAGRRGAGLPARRGCRARRRQRREHRCSRAGGSPLLADVGVARLTGDDRDAASTPAYVDPAVAARLRARPAQRRVHARGGRLARADRRRPRGPRPTPTTALGQARARRPRRRRGSGWPARGAAGDGRACWPGAGARPAPARHGGRPRPGPAAQRRAGRRSSSLAGRRRRRRPRSRPAAARRGAGSDPRHAAAVPAAARRAAAVAACGRGVGRHARPDAAAPAARRSSVPAAGPTACGRPAAGRPAAPPTRHGRPRPRPAVPARRRSPSAGRVRRWPRSSCSSASWSLRGTVWAATRRRSRPRRDVRGTAAGSGTSAAPTQPPSSTRVTTHALGSARPRRRRAGSGGAAPPRDAGCQRSAARARGAGPDARDAPTPPATRRCCGRVYASARCCAPTPRLLRRIVPAGCGLTGARTTYAGARAVSVGRRARSLTVRATLAASTAAVRRAPARARRPAPARRLLRVELTRSPARTAHQRPARGMSCAQRELGAQARPRGRCA